MRIGKIKKLLISATILLCVINFTGCDATMQITSRKQSVSKTSTATVSLYQDYESVVTKQMGNISDHYKTLEETH